MAIKIKKSHEGLLHKDLHVSGDKKIPAAKLEAATHSKDPAVKKRAVFAENAKDWHHGGSAHQPHPKTNPGDYDNEAHGPHSGIGGDPHCFRNCNTAQLTFGHQSSHRQGSLRVSGHKGAHQIGKRK